MLQNQRQRYVSSSSPGGGTGGEVAVYDCRLVTDEISWNRNKSFILYSVMTDKTTRQNNVKKQHTM